MAARLDFETYSEAGLCWDPLGKKWRSPRWGPDSTGSPPKGIAVVGAAVYAMHPSTEILTFAYNIGTGEQIWIPGMPPPADLIEYVLAGGLIEAANSGFEFLIWNCVGVRQLGLPPLPLSQLRCTLARARAFNLPPSLGAAAAFMGLSNQKDKTGKELIDLFSVPQNPTKKQPELRLNPLTHPRGPELYGYCLQDIRTEGALSEAIPELSPDELAIWLLDQTINMRGVQIDTDGVRALWAAYKIELQRQTERLTVITGGAVNSPGKVAQIKAHLEAIHGIRTNSLDAEAVDGLLKLLDPASVPAEILRIRAEAGSSNVKKLMAFGERTCPDGRARGITVYSKAQTGRWAGEGVQAQNLASAGPAVVRSECCGTIRAAALGYCPNCVIGDSAASKADWGPEAVDRVIADAKSGDIFHKWPDVIGAITGCLRGLFIAADGCELVSSDYTAIEAVVLACLAGEQWRIDVFNTHGKIYEMSAAKISGVPFEEILAHKKTTGDHHPLRKTIGKVAELASGYAGWIGAWCNFGADKFMSEPEIKAAILKWREESPKIVEFWGGQYRRGERWGDWRPELYGLEGMAVAAVQTPGQWFMVGQIGYYSTGAVLFCGLPSGRTIAYQRPQLDAVIDNLGRRAWQLSYEGWNSDSSKGPIGWFRKTLYGGLLCENVVQAVARDIMANGLRNVEAAGYYVVMHVHDEIVSEVPAGFGTVEEFERLMCDLPHWCKGWPIKAAGGWRGRRYRKE